MRKNTNLQVWSGQRGDTLVEVILAIAILSMVLVSSFNIASAAFRLGQSAKERSQAANLIQEQAEALRNYRDSHKWSSDPTVSTDMMARLSTVGFTPSRFHMANSGNWDFVGGALQSGLFRVYVVATRDAVDPDDKVRFDITAEWEPSIGSNHACPSGFVGNCTTVSTYLVNLDDFAPIASGGPVGPPPPPPPPPPPSCPNVNISFPLLPSSHLYHPVNPVWSTDISAYTSGLSTVCQYRVIMTTADPGHPDGDVQDNERLCLRFKDSIGNTIVSTSMTDDIPPNPQFQTTDLGIYNFTARPTSIDFVHYFNCAGGGADPGPNSVYPSQITLTIP